ncbi:MAG: DUF4149 domain-containing protein [Nitrospirae bacterium]|nr:DUF4149 domain-containing protein [Nitrospirota bacterium]
MKILNSFFIWLELVGLGVWVGGMLTVGALVAPTVFNTVKPIEMAGEAMSLVFRRFNGGLVYVCIVLVVLGFLGKGWLGRSRGARLWIEGALATVMVLTGLYIGAILGPRMQELRQIRLADPSNGSAVAEFDRGHRTSETLFSVNLLLGLAVLWMNSRPSIGANRKET